MAKPLVIPISFKGTSKKEMELYQVLYSLDDRGDELKRILGEMFLPDKYLKSRKIISDNIIKEKHTSNSNIDITNW